MIDLIDRNEAIRRFDHMRELTADQVVEMLKRVPSCRPTAKWVDMPYTPSHTKYMCSNCGKTIFTNSDYIKEHKFCFSCGADMRGEEE